MRPWRKLAVDQQDDSLSYFQRVEDQGPDVGRILVCDNCDLVYDDFSGESKSMEGDERTICKVCNALGVWYMGPSVNSGELPRF